MKNQDNDTNSLAQPVYRVRAWLQILLRLLYEKVYGA